MRRIILILSAILSIQIYAQESITIDSLVNVNSCIDTDTIVTDSTLVVLIVDDMPYVVVHQDSVITEMMYYKRIGYVRGEQIINGFRVQIYASNIQQIAKKEATELQLRMESLIDVPVYTVSEPPFWKVRIGNFESREEADEYKATLLYLFPELISSTYVVPDKIIKLQ